MLASCRVLYQLLRRIESSSISFNTTQDSLLVPLKKWKVYIVNKFKVYLKIV